MRLVFWIEYRSVFTPGIVNPWRKHRTELGRGIERPAVPGSWNVLVHSVRNGREGIPEPPLVLRRILDGIPDGLSAADSLPLLGSLNDIPIVHGMHNSILSLVEFVGPIAGDNSVEMPEWIRELREVESKLIPVQYYVQNHDPERNTPSNSGAHYDTAKFGRKDSMSDRICS